MCQKNDHMLFHEPRITSLRDPSLLGAALASPLEAYVEFESLRLSIRSLFYPGDTQRYHINSRGLGLLIKLELRKLKA